MAWSVKWHLLGKKVHYLVSHHVDAFVFCLKFKEDLDIKECKEGEHFSSTVAFQMHFMLIALQF